jgi:hypothetical protein
MFMDTVSRRASASRHGLDFSRASVARPRAGMTVLFTPALVEAVESRVLMSLSVPTFSSDPASVHKLFLDFDGAAAPADWANASTTPAFDQDGVETDFSSNELDAISEIWARVADRYAPFNVDVTPVDPGNRNNGATMCVVIGGDGWWYGNGAYGGVAMAGGFDNQYSNTAFVFSAQAPYNLTYIGNTAAHEAGHGFGLDHQSNRNEVPGEPAHEYNAGGYDPSTSSTVGPVMGDTNTAASGWWHGPTPDIFGSGEVTLQNDVALLAASLGNQPDDAGNARVTSTPVGALNGAVDLRGVVETVGDADWRSFTTQGGQATLYVNLDVAVPSMLSPVVELRDATGALVATAHSVAQYGLIETTLAAGTYHLVVRGDGWLPISGSNDGLTNAYADIGAYHIIGAIELTTPPVTVRVNATGTPITLTDGRIFSAASGFAHATGGGERTIPFEVAGTSEDELFYTMRWGSDFSFARAVPNGSYTVYLYFSEPTHTAAGERLFDVSAEGTTVLANYDVFARGGYRTMHKVSVPVTVADGQLNLRFLGKVGVAMVSAVTIAPRHEAELATRNGPVISAQHIGYTGAGYTDFVADYGETLQFTVDVPVAGRFQVVFRYANGSTTDRPLSLAVNGVTKTSSLSFAPTGAWSTWREVAFNVDLAAGTNIIRLSSTGSSGANVDWLALA